MVCFKSWFSFSYSRFIGDASFFGIYIICVCERVVLLVCMEYSMGFVAYLEDGQKRAICGGLCCGT